MNRAGLLLSAVLAASCASAELHARRALEVSARAVRAADEACAALALSGELEKPKAIKLARDCARGYSVARSALLAAQSGVDAADAATLACAGADALAGLASIVRAVRASGGEVPKDIEEGLAAAAMLTRLAKGATCGSK